MFPLAFVADSLQGHWWGFISRNCVVWPIFFLMNVYIALKGTHFWILFPFSAVWSRFTLFAILSSLIEVFTICYSQHCDESLHCLHFKHSDQGLHYLPFSAVWSGSTLFAILSIIRVYTICPSQQSDQGLQCHSHQSDQGLHYLPFSANWSRSRSTVILRNSVNRVYTICNSQQSHQGLHCLPFSAVWSGSTLFAIFCSLIRVYAISHSFSDQCLHC